MYKPTQDNEEDLENDDDYYENYGDDYENSEDEYKNGGDEFENSDGDLQTDKGEFANGGDGFEIGKHGSHDNNDDLEGGEHDYGNDEDELTDREERLKDIENVHIQGTNNVVDQVSYITLLTLYNTNFFKLIVINILYVKHSRTLIITL